MYAKFHQDLAINGQFTQIHWYQPTIQFGKGVESSFWGLKHPILWGV
jgi:hypothetical protein